MTDDKSTEYTWDVPSMNGRVTFHAVWTMPARNLDLCVNSHHIGIFTLEEAAGYLEDLKKSLKGMEELSLRLHDEPGEVIHAFNPGCGTSIETIAYVRLKDSEEHDDPQVTILPLFEAREFCYTLTNILCFIRWKVRECPVSENGGMS